VTVSRIVATVGVALVVMLPAQAHPGSGIVADKSGQIYFIDTGAGIWTIDAKGALLKVPGPNFHWLALDPDGRFGKARLPSGAGGEVTRSGADGKLLAASDFPLVVASDGNLYYPTRARGGSLQIVKLTPAGGTSARASLPLPWVNGLAAGPDGALYATGKDSIRKIDRAGRVSLIVDHLALTGCASVPAYGAADLPDLRGLDVDAHGAIVVAAAGCGRVIRVTPDGKVTTVVEVAAPWSPTAVVHVGNDLYVLEYLHTANEDRKAWVPRVRKVSPDGTSAVIASVTRP
jgi:streptogramin lyase